MGIVMAGIGGFNTGFDDDIDSSAQTLAGTIIGLCGFVLLVNIYSMCILCTYGTYFGIVVNARGRQTVVMASNVDGTTVITMPTATGYGTAGISGNPQTAADIEALQAQNRLLQQQIDLQQQLLNQQQQQQQQTQYGFSQPPTYGFSSADPAYPPTAPPPSYDKVT